MYERKPRAGDFVEDDARKVAGLNPLGKVVSVNNFDGEVLVKFPEQSEWYDVDQFLYNWNTNTRTWELGCEEYHAYPEWYVELMRVFDKSIVGGLYPPGHKKHFSWLEELAQCMRRQNPEEPRLIQLKCYLETGHVAPLSDLVVTCVVLPDDAYQPQLQADEVLEFFLEEG